MLLFLRSGNRLYGLDSQLSNAESLGGGIPAHKKSQTNAMTEKVPSRVDMVKTSI